MGLGSLYCGPVRNRQRPPDWCPPAHSHTLRNRHGAYSYRLRLNDLDGHAKYSQVLRVRPDCSNGDSYLIYPNPVKDVISI